MRFAIGVAVLAAVAAIGAWGAPVDEATALTVAERFLQTSKMAARALPDRSVESIEQRGNLWIARLEPSGHILVSGSDRATPIIGFPENDFSEGEEDSAERAMLDAADAAVAAAEADEAKGHHARWDSLLAEPGTRKSARRLLKSSGTDTYIEPFVKTKYNQNQPWNDFTPVTSKDEDCIWRGRSCAGCVSIADAAIFRELRWPIYLARTDSVTHNFRGSMFAIRFDGSAPFDWDKIEDTYSYSGDMRGTIGAEEDKRYEIGRYIMWLNHSAAMTYSVGASTSTKYTAAHGCERDWYTIGWSMSPADDGVEEKVTGILNAGIPVFVGVGGHAAVADGWKTDGDGTYVDLVYGWGGAGSWYNLETGPVKYFWVDHYPRAKPQLDPIPRVVGDSVTISWHFPDCYTNKLNGFVVRGKRRTSAALTDWTADFSKLATTGNAYPAGIWSAYTFANEDGTVALDAGDLTYGFYQFSTPLTITENSVLSLNVRGGGYSSGDANKGNVVIEICGDDGNWSELFVPECNWSFWPGAWKPNSCSLAAYAGQTVQLRIYKRHTTYNGRVDIGDFKVTNVIPLEGDTILRTAAATDRSITLTGLQSGSDYSFTVMPYLYGALVPGETSDAKFTSIAETSLCLPEITLLQYQADGNALKNLTDGILADGAIGTMTIKVGCSGNVADLKASPSHVELVDDSKVHIEKKSDGYWYTTFDPSISENRNRQRQILTLHAKDSNGTTIHRDIVMRMTADSGIEGGADVDDDIMLYTPKARPIAVWNGDFNSVTTRGAVTLNLNGNITTNDGAAVVKTAGKSGIDFAIAGGGTFIFGIAGVSEFAITSEDTATLISVATSAAEEDAGLGVSCQNSGLYKYRGLLGSVKGDWFTGGNTYPNDGGLHSLAFKATTEKVECWLDASASSENSESVYSTTYVRLENSATTDLVLGGWKSATAFGATGTKFNHVAVFTDDNVSAGDMYNWNLKNMTGAVTVPASGGALTALDTGRNLGINLNGGRVALDEPVYAAALFVQDDTTLEVPMGFGVSGSRVLYVAPGKTLTVDVICDGTALSNAVSAAGGVYTSRILQGANYGDVVSGSLPDIGSRYTVELVQVDTEGVYFRVTDTRALNIYNDDGSDVPVGYVTDAGKSCIITNATGLITIPAMVEQVNIYAKDDVLNFKVAAGSSPNFVIYASNAAGKPEPGSGWGIVLTSLFARPDSGDDTIISLALDPEAVHNDVKVRPEFDMTAADEVLSFSGTGENKIVALPVKVIPGLWYCVEYADNVGFDGSFMTSPATVTTVGAKSTTLTAPASATKTFYRVRVGSSKSSLTVQ